MQSGLGYIIFILLFVSFFIGMSLIFYNNVNDVNYKEYQGIELNESNYSNSSGLPSGNNPLSYLDFMRQVITNMPNIKGFEWFSYGLLVTFIVVVVIVVIRGVS